ncbi:hypothetical protein C943_04102 [Mariniradius saccharolyticus AK6]|uniref:Periplasmic membrane protein n=1 Tax=Mariniradius saccharolyticus AK6 TaxID=1239962 RepID=M7XGW9_9BACT|nr:YdeI/OmpD-associated family protein [Mariniradius saccharolyticus]EMS33783.1 hypothetical protein C943_04102 [Mariniradius saccharolyticus AK6]
MERYNGVLTFQASNQEEWRKWLHENHLKEKSIWLIIYRKESGIPSVYYPEAVDEALCFGWIDSKPNKRDEVSYYQFFSKRNPKSKWSKVNKDKIERLVKEGRMHPAGTAMVALAKEKGTWSALEEVDQLILPADLAAEFDKNPQALSFWERFSKSSRRGIMEWILNAKRPETRNQRIEETVRLAGENKKANQYIPKTNS